MIECEGCGMIRLYEITNYPAKSKDEALNHASEYARFRKEDFKCEVVKEPKRVGLFKWEKGLYNCWYEHPDMELDKEFWAVRTHLYFDTKQKKMLVFEPFHKTYEVDYSDLIDYEMVIVSSISNRTRTISNKNNALKGGILFGVTGAVIGAADSETITETSTSEVAELIIRLKFENKESIEIKTCDQKCNVTTKDWRDILDQSKVADEFFRELLENV